MANFALRAAALPHWQQRMALRLLQAFGWTLRYKPLPGPHGVVIVYPHTSNWDFLVGILAKWAVGLPFRWLGKESLFKGLLGPVMRAWGGVPVERGTATGATERLAARMHESDWFWLALAPEGTRSYRPHWRSGFYHLTLAARVPLVLVYLDYPRREIGVLDALRLSGDQQADMAAIARVYEGHLGKRPEQAAPITLAPPRSGDTNKQA